MSELKQQGCCKGFVSLGRWRPQQECQKSSKFILAKEQLCTCSILLGTFFSFSTTTWNCLVSRFIEEVIGTLIKQRRRRQQQERQKRNRFDKQNNNFAHASHHALCTFHCRHRTTMKWKRLISRFVKDGNKRQRLSFSFPVLWHCPLEFNSRKICQHLTNCNYWNKRDRYFY